MTQEKPKLSSLSPDAPPSLWFPRPVPLSLTALRPSRQHTLLPAAHSPVGAPSTVLGEQHPRLKAPPQARQEQAPKLSRSRPLTGKAQEAPVGGTWSEDTTWGEGGSPLSPRRPCGPHGASPSPKRVRRPIIVAVCRESWSLGGHEAESCSLSGSPAEQTASEFTGLSGRKDKAHVTTTQPGSEVTAQEGSPCQSQSPSDYLLTRTEDPSRDL